MISSQILREQGEKYWSKKSLSKRLNDFKNFIFSIIISLFFSKLFNFDPFKNKCESLSLDKSLGNIKQSWYQYYKYF